MKVAIIGGGMMGLSIGYCLSKAGAQVEVYEAADHVGGLADSACLNDGTVVDRFYHTILSSDRRLLELCAELRLTDLLHFRQTRMGFYHNGDIYSMNGMIEFLRFPPLNWLDRMRLGFNVLYAQVLRDWRQLETVSVDEWLIRLSGKRTYENIWRPMLKAKFDGDFAHIPATYIWARLVRMKSTRSGATQKEQAGHLIGGYPTLMEAIAARIRENGNGIHLRQPVQEIWIEDGSVRGIRVSGEQIPFDAVIAAVPVPAFRDLLPAISTAYHDFLAQTEYLSIICPILVLDRSLTGFWTLNITDDRIPFTGIIETTAYIDPTFVGGQHLVYLPKYVAPGSPWLSRDDVEIRRMWLVDLERMFPEFDRRWIRDFVVHRERFVEPLHGLDSSHTIPEIETPVHNLYLATTAQIYPTLTNCESVVGHAAEAASIVMGTEYREQLFAPGSSDSPEKIFQETKFRS